MPAILLLCGLLVFGPIGDFLQPVLPAIRLTSLALAIAFGFGLALHTLRPASARLRLLPVLAAVLLFGFVGIALVQCLAGTPRGLLAGRVPELAHWQDRLLHTQPPPPWPINRLRAALAQGVPRPSPLTPDEFLFNALLMRDRAEAGSAAAALAESLRLATSPRPDALLLYADLMRRPAARRLLEPLAANLPAESRLLVAALMVQDPAARVTALQAVLVEQSGNMLAIAALAQARIAASLPEGPTIAIAARIAEAVARFADAERFGAFAAEFLNLDQAQLLGQSIAQLGWTQEMAERRLAVATLMPPPEAPDQPALLRIIVPEPARAVQIWQSEQAEWVTLPQQAPGTGQVPEKVPGEVPGEVVDPVPTLRLPRPFQPRRIRLRYLDRDGVASAELVQDFNPVAAIRAQAQRSLERQGPFALYQPGWVAPGQLNPLPLSGQARAGLRAIEWRSDTDATPRSLPVALPDAALLDGVLPRILVQFPVAEDAHLLILTAIYADGSRGETTGLPIR